MNKERELMILLESFHETLIRYRLEINKFTGLSDSLKIEVPQDINDSSLDFKKQFIEELDEILVCYKIPILHIKAQAIQKAIKKFMYVTQNVDLCNRFLQMSVSIAFLNGDISFLGFVDMRINGPNYLQNTYGEGNISIVKIFL